VYSYFRFATLVAGNPANKARKLGFSASYKFAHLAGFDLTDFLTFGLACTFFAFFLRG
jgi:hypothetical protein